MKLSSRGDHPRVMQDMKRQTCKVIAILLLLNLSGGFQEISAQANPDQEVKNLAAFAKAYGYVRFFYPNAQTRDFNWDAFLVYGVEQVRDLKTTDELKAGLSDLFSHIAPYASFTAVENSTLEVRQIFQGDSITFWQHAAFSIGENMGAKSDGNNIRVLVTAAHDSTKIIQADSPLLADRVQPEFVAYSNFNKYYYPDNFRPRPYGNRYVLDIQPNPSVPFSSKLIDDLWITMPIALDREEAKHLRQNSGMRQFSNVMQEFDAKEKSELEEENIWYADFILAWNAFHHLYPYRKRSERMFGFSSSEQLTIGLGQISNSTDKKSTSYAVVKNYVTSFQDGHANVSRQQNQKKNNQDTKAPKRVRSWLPFYRTYAEGKIYVLRSFDPKIKRGDQLLAINDKDITAILDTQVKNQKATPQLNLISAVNTVGSLFDTSEAEVRLKRGDEILTVKVNTLSQKEYFKHFRNPYGHKPIEFPVPGTVYINPTLASQEDFENSWDKIIAAKHLIFDLRLYPNSLRKIFNHLPVDQGLGKGLIISSPLNMYPNQKLQHHIWHSALTVSKEPFINAEISVLVARTTMSRGETFASYLKYAGATLIGDGNTAGASGGLDWFTTPGNIKIFLTASYTVREEGEEMQSVGITPDILVILSVDGLMAGKDQVYEAALKRVQD